MSLDNIKHIVVLMLENRSLDNLLGWLHADTGNRPRVTIPPFPEVNARLITHRLF